MMYKSKHDIHELNFTHISDKNMELLIPGDYQNLTLTFNLTYKVTTQLILR